ncbi:hypothetical protein TNCV_672931 [Trichonephila clavipes]|nr:hypothetical protein TNCV_672931 [Trichonephila clavipes]
MPSPVQSIVMLMTPLQTGSTVLSGQWYTHQQVCVRIVLLPSNIWQQFFGRSAFLRQQETYLPPAELCQRIRWEQNEAISPDCTQPIVQAKCKLLKDWGLLGWNWFGSLISINDNRTGNEFLSNLEIVVKPLMEDTFPDGQGIYQDDNTPLHAKTVQS